MPYFWDITPETLPRPDLNPLTNPALERNLSRWAAVYFGNPPGKREEAVNRLLQEIKNETSEILQAELARRDTSSRPPEAPSAQTTPAGISLSSTEVQSPEAEDAGCPNCGHRNPAEHQFCGQCGGGLNPVESRSGVSAVRRNQQLDDEAPVQPGSDVPWLRERALGHFYDDEAPAWRGWKYMLGAVTIALAGLAYMQWNMSQPTGVVPARTARMNAPASQLPSRTSTDSMQRPAAASPSPSHEPASTQPVAEMSGSKSPEIQSSVGTVAGQGVQDRRADPPGIQPAVQKHSLLGAPSTRRNDELGNSANPDLLLAQRYLAGSMGVRDSTEAAKLLWKAVGKQNATAAILLSGLYARGDGVPKSCDQARLLLVAATRQRSPQAAEQLRYLEQYGCQ